MDIYCRICSEPWDMDTLHEVIAERIERGDFAPLPDHDGYKQASPKYKHYRTVYDGYYSQVRSEFYAQGCAALTGYSSDHCVKPERTRSLTRGQAMSALIDVMGDDLDGIASMMDDAEYMGLFN